MDILGKFEGVLKGKDYYILYILLIGEDVKEV